MHYLILLALSVVSLMAQSVTLNWTANTGNPTGVQYNVYRATGACGTTQTFAKINTVGIAPLNYTDTAITRGNTYCYRVTAFLGAAESAPSPTAQAVIPLGAPTNLTITVDIAVNVNVNGAPVVAKIVGVQFPEVGQ